ncbi:MAG: AsmA-like C-terminal region-containing protein, partial [Planctomycetota bacterium]
VEGSVVATSPWITFLEDEKGRRNTEGLFPERKKRRKMKKPGEGGLTGMRWTIAVHDGVLRARGPGEAVPQEVRALEAKAEVRPDGSLTATLQASARGAAPDGSDVTLDVSVALPAAGEGPVKVTVPPIDLARIGRIVEGATGIRDLAGRIQMDVDATARPGPVLSGKLSGNASGVAFTLEDGTRVGVADLQVVADLLPGAATTMGDLLLRGKGLRIGPGSVSLGGYEERAFEFRVKAERSTADQNGPTTLRLTAARSTLLSIDPVAGLDPITVTLGGGSPTRIDGAARATLDLAALARALGGVLALAPTDRMGGRLTWEMRLALEGDTGRVDTRLGGQRLVMPASWGEGLPPADVEGKVNFVLAGPEVVVEVPSLRGFGFDLVGEASLRRDEAVGETSLARAHVEATGDLARARAVLAPLLGLGRRAALTGAVHAVFDVVPRGGARDVKGRVTVRDVTWRDERGVRRVREPLVEGRLDVRLAPPGGRNQVRTIRLSLPGLTATLEGFVGRAGEEQDLDLALGLDGDAARLAPTLARILGKGYADLRGQGPVKGTLTLRGKTGRGGADLLPSGTIQPGAWSTGGLRLSATTLAISRTSTRAPLTLVLRSDVNRGKLAFRLNATPGPGAVPWQATIDLKGLDTSPLLVNQGLGSYLALLFPTIVPSDVQTTVLSGMLDADVSLAATDVSSPALSPSLTGSGRIVMKEGRIGESTLFRAAGGRGGLGKIEALLAAAVPEVGRELEGLSRTLTFRSLVSKFVVAREIITIRHGLLEGARVNVGFTGTVGFDERANLDVLVTLGGKAGKRLGRVLPSKTIPLKVRGPLSKPQVVPNLKAGDLQRGALEGLLGGGKGENPIDRLKGLLGR